MVKHADVTAHVEAGNAHVAPFASGVETHAGCQARKFVECLHMRDTKIDEQGQNEDV